MLANYHIIILENSAALKIGFLQLPEEVILVYIIRDLITWD